MWTFFVESSFLFFTVIFFFALIYKCVTYYLRIFHLLFLFTLLFTCKDRSTGSSGNVNRCTATDDATATGRRLSADRARQAPQLRAQGLADQGERARHSQCAYSRSHV